MQYARGTRASIEKSIGELTRSLSKAGARAIVIGDDTRQALAHFELGGRKVRSTCPMPKPDDDEFFLLKNGKQRSPEACRILFEQACRERWRQFILLNKGKLVAIRLGITTVDKEYLSDLLLPDGATVFTALSQAAPSLVLGRPLLGPKS